MVYKQTCAKHLNIWQAFVFVYIKYNINIFNKFALKDKWAKLLMQYWKYHNKS